jgi:hypothetical protein
VVLVCPGADKTQRAPILGRARAHQSRYLHFAHRSRHTVEILDQQLRWNFVEKFVNAGGADCAQHVTNLVIGVRYKWHGIYLFLKDNYSSNSSINV